MTTSMTMNRTTPAMALIAQITRAPGLRRLVTRLLRDERGGLTASIIKTPNLASIQPRVGLMLVDLDMTGTMGGPWGAAVGDALLSELGRRLRVLCGAQNPSLVCTGSGFAVLLPCHTRDEADQLALSYLRALQAPVRIGGRDVVAHVSLGLAIGPQETRALHQSAQRALQTARAAGGRGWRVA